MLVNGVLAVWLFKVTLRPLGLEVVKVMLTVRGVEPQRLGVGEAAGVGHLEVEHEVRGVLVIRSVKRAARDPGTVADLVRVADGGAVL